MTTSLRSLTDRRRVLDGSGVQSRGAEVLHFQGRNPHRRPTQSVNARLLGDAIAEQSSERDATVVSAIASAVFDLQQVDGTPFRVTVSGGDPNDVLHVLRAVCPAGCLVYCRGVAAEHVHVHAVVFGDRDHLTSAIHSLGLARDANRIERVWEPRPRSYRSILVYDLGLERHASKRARELPIACAGWGGLEAAATNLTAAHCIQAAPKFCACGCGSAIGPGRADRKYIGNHRARAHWRRKRAATLTATQTAQAVKVADVAATRADTVAAQLGAPTTAGAQRDRGLVRRARVAHRKMESAR